MPTIKVDVPLKDFEGKPVMVPVSRRAQVTLCPECTKALNEAEEHYTLRKACTRALTAITEESQKESGETKFERGLLAAKIHDQGTVHLQSEEIAIIKKCIGKVEGPLIVWATYNMLDPVQPEEEKDDSAK